MNFYIIAEGDFDKNKNKNYTRTIQINEKKKELQRRNRYNIWIKENDTENNEKIKTLVNQEDYSSALVVFLEYLASLKSSISAVCPKI